MAMLFLPDVTGLGVTPNAVLAATAANAAATQVTVAAENAPIRPIYGQPRSGAQIAAVISYLNTWVILAVWGQGEVDSILAPLMDDKALPGGSVVTHYTGTQTQSPDPTLVAAYAAQSPAVAYTDSLIGIAYSVFRITSSLVSVNLTAQVKGLKVYDPRLDTTNGGTGSQRLLDPLSWAWNDCAALCHANFLSNNVYGANKTIDWSSVIVAANFNDSMIGTPAEKSRTLNLVIDTVSGAKDWAETLRTYSSCWAVPSGSVIKLVPDTPASSVASFDTTNILSVSSMKKRGLMNVPTVMIIEYTDTTTIPYRTARAYAYAAGVQAGTTPRRESTVQLPGITRYSQAYREAVERLNKLAMNDLSFALTVPDIGIKVETGDVIDVTHPIGLSAKLMRIGQITNPAAGEWVLNLVEYDPGVYDTSVQTAPTYNDTTQPSPNSPTPPTALVITESTFRDQAVNLLRSRLTISWMPPANFPFVAQYRVEVYDGATLVDSSPSLISSYTTPVVQQGRTLTVNVYTVSTTQAPSTALSGSIFTVGKVGTFPPTVTGFDGFEVGGRVYSKWDKSADADVQRYALRAGLIASSPTWANSGPDFDVVDTLAKVIEGFAAGSYRFFISAIDSIGQYSVTAASKDIVVTTDKNFAILDTVYFTNINPALSGSVWSNVKTYRISGDTHQYFVTDSGATWDSLFPAAMDGYPLPLSTYFSAASLYMSEAYDFGLSITAQWTLTANVVALLGTCVVEMGLSADNTTYTWSSITSQKATARFVKVRVSTAAGSSFKMTGYPSIRAQVVTKGETGVITTSASLPATVLLTGNYAKYSSIGLTPQGVGTALISPQVDQIALYPLAGEFVYLESLHSGASSYAYVKIDSPAYVIQAGDFLWWDAYAIDYNTDGGMRLDFTDFTTTAAANDQDAVSGILGSALNYQTWHTRKIDLTTWVGKTLSIVNIINEDNAAAKHRALFANVKIATSTGTLRQAIWSAGSVANRTVTQALLATNIICNRGNSFDVYALNQTPAKVAVVVSYDFSGV